MTAGRSNQVRGSKQASITLAARQTQRLPPTDGRRNARGADWIDTTTDHKGLSERSCGVGACFGNMEKDFVHMGLRWIWGQDVPFGLSGRDRRQHCYIIGQTGTGKTTLLRNLIVQDLEAGRGLMLIDPHGDLAEELLDYIPPRRIDDVVYFNPADVDYPIGLSLLQRGSEEEHHLAASGLLSVFKSIWRDSWGPRLEYILYAATAALLECQNTSILGLPRLLVDERYRSWVLRQVKDPVVRSFWLSEYANYDRRFLAEAIAPVQNKVGQLLMASPVRNIVGQVRSKIDPRFMMDDGRVLIANLSKGRLGADKANLLGAVLVNQFQLAAMARANVEEEKRRDFFMFVDEFQNFSTDAFTSVLSEARKYRISLTLSHQYITQLRDDIREAVFGNVGSLIAFRVGEEDALVLERQFAGEYPAGQFSDLVNHAVYARLLVDGEPRSAFLGRTFPAFGKRYGRRRTVINRSREKYATPRGVVEGKINRWMRV